MRSVLLIVVLMGCEVSKPDVRGALRVSGGVFDGMELHPTRCALRKARHEGWQYEVVLFGDPERKSVTVHVEVKNGSGLYTVMYPGMPDGDGPFPSQCKQHDISIVADVTPYADAPQIVFRSGHIAIDCPSLNGRIAGELTIDACKQPHAEH